MDIFKRSFRSGITLFSCLLLMLCNLVLIKAEEDLPSRAIYVVYDDSGSMYLDYDTKEMVDTWSKAKYSMEVFASMIAPEDTMKIFYMSDYSNTGEKKGPRIEISGHDNPTQNIEKIHDEQTTSGQTPFETVEAAYESLEQSNVDEKWLIVLTDGDFQKNGEIDNDKSKVTAFMNDYFAQKDENVNVAFLAMGDSVVPVNENKDENIYFYRASNSNEILDEVTEISNRIFNSNRLDVSADNGEFNLDIPMSSLTVFVQGDGSVIDGLVDESGKPAGTMTPAVTVSATGQSDNTAHKDNPPADGLYGELAVFEGPFSPGKYKVQSKNAKKIEVYFKPFLEVAAYLTTSDGQRIDDFTDLPTGDYQLHFELLNGIDHTELPQKNIVNQSEYGIEYKAEIFNNGELQDRIFGDGDMIHINQGSLDIDVTATYLKYNTSKTKLQYSVWKEKNVTFEQDDTPEWTLTKGLIANEPLTIVMKVEGKQPTQAEWEAFEIPEVSAAANDDALIDRPTIKKGEEPGQLLIEPASEQTRFSGIPYENVQIVINVDQDIESIPWIGEGEAEVPIKDSRMPLEKHAEWLRANWWLPILLILLLIALAGYIPGIKKYLPKTKKKLTTEIHSLKNRKEKDKTSLTELKKDMKSTLIPYVRQKGSLRVIPIGDYDHSKLSMQLEAAGNSGMILTNPKKFKEVKLAVSGRELVQEDYAKENSKKGKVMTVTGKSTIVVETPEYIFTTKLK